MGGFEPKNKFPEGDIECQLCSDKFSGHMRLRSLTRHLKENHGGITLKEYFDMFYGTERDSHCLHCGKEAPWYKSFYRDFCDRSCDTAFRNTQNWKEEEYRKTRSEFVKGQWKDEKFRKMMLETSSKTIKKTLKKQWKNEEYRKAQSDRAVRRLRDENDKFGTNTKTSKYKNILMRSEFEVNFAKELDCVGIKWSYEPLAFRMNSNSFVPDFYIKKLDLFVEIKSNNWVSEKIVNQIEFIKLNGHNAILLNPKNWDTTVGEIISKAINLKGGEGGLDGFSIGDNPCKE
jgi:hypothetical protein